MRSLKQKLFLLTLLGALMLGISFPFTGGIYPLSFLALVPLLLYNFKLNDAGVKRRFFKRLGVNYLYFVIFNAITVWWIYNASDAGAYMAIFANALLMCVPFHITAFLTKHLGEGKGLLSFVVLWLSFEFCHYHWELSWPWLNLGHVLGDAPMLIQWYEYSGVAGGTLWILLINIGVYIVARNVWFRQESFKIQTPILFFLGLAMLIPILSSIVMFYNYNEDKTQPVDITIVQPNIESHQAKFSLPSAIQLNKLLLAAESKIDENSDLILAPETAIPYPVNEELLDQHPDYLGLLDFIRTHHQIPMLIGADTYRIYPEKKSPASTPYGQQWYENYNTALMIQANNPKTIYHKAKLVLGGEKLPFVAMFPFLQEYSVELGGTSGMLGVGEEPIVFEAKGVKYAPLICYESVYGDYVSMFVRKGATVLTVITNDGWWGDTPGYKQHRMFSQIRAIENRRYVARSANTGISCFINPKGEVVSELVWEEYGAIREVVYEQNEITFFTKYGDFLGRISAYLALAMMLYGLVERLKKLSYFEKINTGSNS